MGLVAVIAGGAVSALANALVLGNAPRLGLLQAPNVRSSHHHPTPTGGGIGIVVGATAAVFIGVGVASPQTATIVLASLALALLGLWDDISPLPPAIRLVVQLALAVLIVAFALPLPALGAALGVALPAPLLLALLTVLLVYWINLYNFMDGIDGIAGSEAAFLLLAPPALVLLGGGGVATSPLFWWALGIAAPVGAFLAFNWHPARLFMGDVGSLFLGLMTAALLLLDIAAGSISLWQALILCACFATDGTVTILRRAVQREAIMTAHRRHAYQWLARRYGSHSRVVLSDDGRKPHLAAAAGTVRAIAAVPGAPADARCLRAARRGGAPRRRGQGPSMCLNG